jgi:hypothetical protein
VRSPRLWPTCLVLLLSTPVSARVLDVDPSGGGDYLTLPEAWAAAGPQDTVLMAQATHLVGWGNPSAWPLELDANSPAVVGDGEPGSVVLLGDGIQSAFYIPDGVGARVHLQRLSFKNIPHVLGRIGYEEVGGGSIYFAENIVDGCGGAGTDAAVDARSCWGTIARNVIKNSPGTGLLTDTGTSLFIRENEICGNGQGICLWGRLGPELLWNWIHDNILSGIQMEYFLGGRLEYNTIEANGTGLVILGSAGTVQHNVVRGNATGMVGYGIITAAFHFNDLCGNVRRNVRLSSSDPWVWDCTSNWWGTVDPDEISHDIWDCDDDPDVAACVAYDPWCFAPGCEPTPVHPTTWSSVKAMYR